MVDLDYDENESSHLDPTGATGGITSGDIETNTDLDTCAGLSEYRAAGNFAATDKGTTEGFVVGEIAWLMKAVPQKWPGLSVMSTYRSPLWNLTSAYYVDPAKAKLIETEWNNQGKTREAASQILKKYGVVNKNQQPKMAALTSNHVQGRAVDFAGSEAESYALAAWARKNDCLRISEVLWQVPGHYKHVHLGV
jgi:hypothetical protein